MAYPRLDGLIDEAAWGIPRPKQEPDTEALAAALRIEITRYLKDIEYQPPVRKDSQVLWTQMHRRAAKMNIPNAKDTFSYKCFITGGSYAVLCFPNHPLDVQVFLGLFTWFAVMVDEQASNSPEDFNLFGQRLLRGEKQSSGLAAWYAEILLESYDHYDAFLATCIVSSALAFVNACVLEKRKEFRDMVPTITGQSWPWYKRSKCGLGEAFACFTFSKVLCPDMSLFMEALPDLDVFLVLTNDILSFYKEEMACETKNYVNVRALYENRTPLSVLTNLVQEAEHATHRVREILANRGPYEQALHDHIMGYIAFHTRNKRYQLVEIGVGEDDCGIFEPLLKL